MVEEMENERKQGGRVIKISTESRHTALLYHNLQAPFRRSRNRVFDAIFEGFGIDPHMPIAARKHDEPL
jgi:hypothetical protein